MKGNKKIKSAIPSAKLNNVIIAWAAGIYEGEGSCVKTGSRSLDVNVPQKDPWLIFELLKYFGGRYYKNKAPNGNPIYRWHVFGARARGFLILIYSMLSPRRQKANFETRTIYTRYN